MTTIRIPQIGRQITPQGRGPSPRANIVDVSSGLESIGKGIEQIGDAVERKKLNDDQIQLLKTQNDASERFTQWMEDAQNKWTMGQPDMPQQFGEEFDKWTASAGGNFKTTKGQQAFKERMDALRSGMLKSAIGWQANTNTKLNIVALDDARINAVKMAARNPEIAQALAESHASGLKDVMIEAPVKAEIGRRYFNDVSLAAEASLLDRAPEAYKADDSRWSWSQLTLEQQERLKNQRDAVLKQKSAKERDLFDEQVKDNTAMYMAGVQPPNEITEAEFVKKYGTQEGPYRFSEYSKARGFGVDVNSLKDMTPKEMEAVLAKNIPTPGEGFASASQRSASLQAAAQTVLDNRAKDPGLYAMQSPLVRISKTEPEQVASSIAVQKSWGISSPKPFPKGVASQKVAEIATMAGDAAVQELNEMKLRYGKNYGAVFSQLASAGLPASYVAIGAGMDSAPASALASIANVDMKSLKAQLPPGITPKAIGDELSGHAGNYIQSLSGMAGSDKTIDAMLEASERLAYKYIAAGSKASAAAEKAWGDVIGSKYDFVLFNGNQVRIPRTVSSGLVSDGLDNIMDRLTDKALMPPKIDLRDYQPEQWADHVKDNGYFVTTENEDGAYLFVDGALVLDAQGKPFTVSWGEALQPSAKRMEPFKEQVGTVFTPQVGGF